MRSRLEPGLVLLTPRTTQISLAPNGILCRLSASRDAPGSVTVKVERIAAMRRQRSGPGYVNSP